MVKVAWIWGAAKKIDEKEAQESSYLRYSAASLSRAHPEIYILYYEPKNLKLPHECQVVVQLSNTSTKNAQLLALPYDPRQQHHCHFTSTMALL